MILSQIFQLYLDLQVALTALIIKQYSKMKKSLIYLFSALIIFMSSCDEKEVETQGMKSDDAKVAIQTVSEDLAVDLIDLTQSKGIIGVKSLFSLIVGIDPFTGGRTEINKEEYLLILKEKANALRIIFSPEKSIKGKMEEGLFLFEENKGEYDWNFIEEQFVKVAASEFIILNFPSQGSETLNATLRITNYEEMVMVDEFGEYYAPTSIEGDLTIDNNLVVDLKFELSYDDMSEPSEGSLYLFLSPFTLQYQFVNASDKILLTASIAKGDEVIVDIDLEATIIDEEGFTTISGVNGSVQYRDVKVAGSLKYTESENPNDFIDLKIYVNDQLLGEVVFVEEADEFSEDGMEFYPYIRYSDGSRERLEDVFEPVIIEVEDFFYELESWGDEGG